MPDPVAHLASGLVAAAEAGNHRRVLVLAGAREWGRSTAVEAVAATPLHHTLWISDTAPEGAWRLHGDQAHQVLGREVDACIFDAHAGFDPDAFGAVAGATRGGGLLILLTPPLDDWPSYADPAKAAVTVEPYTPDQISGRFLQRLARELRTAPGVSLVSQNGPVPAPPQAPRRYVPLPSPDAVYRTDDQRRAVEAVLRVATGRARRPLVLTSDRGRGKSAALGIAAARAMQAGLQRVLVTAPRPDAVRPVFDHAGRLLPGARHRRLSLHYGEQRLEFTPPDELALHQPSADLLLVDEAAAIPAALLERILVHYGRIAFASTIHGYEGTGRGFAIRFRQVLDRRTPHWRQLQLSEPVRWSHGDPLEGLIFRTLLLDASPADDAAVAEAAPATVAVERLDRDRLATDETTLSELFGLLVLAHYRTTPGDLRRLLDGPNVSVYAARHRGHVVATALVAIEGGFDEAAALAVYDGRRRPRGHMVPQTLAAHAGLLQAPIQRCARIMRIAVHPSAWRRGLGARLLEGMIRDARHQGLDYAGAAFGATPELLPFWQRTGFDTVRLGLTRGTTSGSHSAVVICGLSPAGQALADQARMRFRDELPHLLSDPLADLEPELADRLLRGAGDGTAPALSPADWRDVAGFAFGWRLYGVTIAPIWRLTCDALMHPRSAEVLDSEARRALIVKVLQKRGWQETARILGVPGRAAVTERLRHALQPLVWHFADAEGRREAERLGALAEQA